MFDFIRSLLVKAGFGKESIERIENLESEKPVEKPAKKKAKAKPAPVVTTATPKPAKKKERKKVTYNMGGATPPVKVPNLNAMTKEKIVAFAKENGIELQMSMTKKNMIAEVKSKLS